ncbi:MAG TPA: FtsX-like permease family protein [Burkholderiaceae bacterium]|nr:FtsX-like permease family protein [Burkholderiaceae bacterium]
MFFLKLALRNAFRARLRSVLTLLGLVIALVAFGLLQTVVGAWNAGVEMASATRVVTRSAISLTFSLPLYYRDRIHAVEGVRRVSSSNWFGGVWRDEKSFFAQFAVDAQNFFPIYPEFVFKPAEFAGFLRDRQGCVVGRQLADLYGFKVGDKLPIRGTIYPGNWEFNIRAIYDGRDNSTITRQMYFHFDYLNEFLKLKFPTRANRVGVFVMELADPDRVADVSHEIDSQFRNSLAETLTESERSFQLNFLSMFGTIVKIISGVSYVVIAIILAVTTNTMAMTARERLSEYATLKALGFGPGFVASLILAESTLLCAIGGALALTLTRPVAAAFHRATSAMFAVFEVSSQTLQLQAACALAVGLIAALAPMARASRVRIVDGLRHVG